MNDKIVLSPEEIYEKEFKIDARGYRPQEVDNFLDIIIKDYAEFKRIVRGYEKEYQRLSSENANLKAQLRQLQTELETKESDEDNGAVSNVDLLRRISQLEKFVYGKYNK
ncbi:cell division regulator GpsB [bacterium]|uniref:cell division regulator GpsB n=1 Tax=Candidatus Ventrenecus sp. TaxID=3085654 RepID=UPI001DE97EDA|nr:cell division regulator GpsB [bacterium]